MIVHGAQVYMLTPEEVHDYTHDEVKWGPSIEQAAAVNLGTSSWLLSFAQQHLAPCNHYRVMFYDEFLDVICENLSAKCGPNVGE